MRLGNKLAVGRPNRPLGTSSGRFSSRNPKDRYAGTADMLFVWWMSATDPNQKCEIGYNSGFLHKLCCLAAELGCLFPQPVHEVYLQLGHGFSLNPYKAILVMRPILQRRPKRRNELPRLDRIERFGPSAENKSLAGDC